MSVICCSASASMCVSWGLCQLGRQTDAAGPWHWRSPKATPPFPQFTNRCLLKWLKLWDLVVFGQERPARKPRPSVEPARVGKEATTTSKWKSQEQVLEEMLEAELDQSRRPRQKVSPSCLRCRHRHCTHWLVPLYLWGPQRMHIYCSHGCGHDDMSVWGVSDMSGTWVVFLTT